MVVEKTLYSDIQFVKIENLKGRAKAIAEAQGLSEGLALLKVSINSLPEYEIEPIKGDPLKALKNLAYQDGISAEKFDIALANAFS
jgi:hypothetical protein